MSGMIQLAYFFLLCPVGYTGNKSPTTTVQLKNVSLGCGAANFDIFQTPAATLKFYAYGKMEFNTQKNAVWREVVGYGTSGDALMCPNSAMVFHAVYLREHGAAPSQNLATFKRGGRCVNITPKDISRMLKDTIRFLGPSLGFTPKYVSPQSLRAVVAMALLCSSVETDIINLVGLWRSYEMIRYLYVQAKPLMINMQR